MAKKLKPADLLAKALAENNMELVKEAQALLNAPKPKKKKKVAKKEVVAVKATKKVKFKNETEYFEYLQNLADERLQAIIEGRAGALGTNLSIIPDFEDACKDSAVTVDEKKKMSKNKQRPRAAVKYIQKNCPKCGAKVEITSGEAAIYNWDMSKSDSEKTLYICGRCT